MRAALATAEIIVENPHHLPVDPWVYGVTGFGALVALLLVTYAFRSIGTRH